MHTRLLAARSLLTLGVVALAAACGGGSSNSSSTPLGPGYFITISGMSFSPLDLHVPPGGTVTVINRDSMPHSVTSETAANAFTPGAVAGVSFDTGEFAGQKSFTIPTTAAEGTVIPYYCTLHRQTMVTPNGTITVDKSAAQAPASGGSGGGGGY